MSRVILVDVGPTVESWRIARWAGAMLCALTMWISVVNRAVAVQNRVRDSQSQPAG